MQVADYLKLYDLPEPTGPGDLLKAGAVEADLILDKGQAAIRMAQIVGNALRHSKGSAAAAEKEVKAMPAWETARTEYDRALSGLAFIRGYQAAARAAGSNGSA
jgi:hypothetical protein